MCGQNSFSEFITRQPFVMVKILILQIVLFVQYCRLPQAVVVKLIFS